jgi:L-malate glycosyltransferase
MAEIEDRAPQVRPGEEAGFHGSGTPRTVLHLIDCLAPGGSEQQLLHLLRSTDQRRFRPILGTFHVGGMLRGEVEALGIPVTEFPLRSSLLHPNTGLQLGRIVAHCVRERVRIIHAHDFYSNLLGVAAARLTGVRVLVSRGDLAHWLSPLQRRALGVACRASDQVVANARAVAELTDGGLDVPDRLLSVIFNGIDVTGFDREARLPPDPPVDLLEDAEARRFTVAVVANMNTAAKGQADLLEATAALSAAGLPLRLLFVGDGERRPALEAQAAALGLTDRVRFLGRRRDVPRILHRVTAACLPSWTEGLPNSVLEAMLAARPVVVTAVGGCPEIIEHGRTGLLVAPRAPTALAAALARLFGDRAAAERMGRAARAAIAAGFDLPHFVGAYQALYDRLSEAA